MDEFKPFEPKHKITVESRLASMFIDHVIMTAIMAIPIMPFFISYMSKQFMFGAKPDIESMDNVLYALVVAYAIYFNKDLFNGRSLAKRMFKFQIVENKTGQTASPLRCFIRNTTILIWPLEVIFAAINTSRRLGDFIAGTRLEKYQPDEEKYSNRFHDILLPMVLSLGYSWLIIFPLMQQILPSDKTKPEESSYDPELSMLLSHDISEGLKPDCDSVTVFFYHTIENDSLSYISIKYYTGDSLIPGNYINYRKLKNRIIDAVNQSVQPETYLVEGKVFLNNKGNTLNLNISLDPREKYVSYDTHNRTSVSGTSSVLRTTYDNGITKSEAKYERGKITEYHEWYENGQLKTEVEYKDGVRNGLTTEWYENGQKKCVMLYKDNTYQRDIGRWNESGLKTSFTTN